MKINFFKKKSDTFDYTESHNCKCCGNKFIGRYCNVCGEKVIDPNERSIASFLGSLVNAFTFLDGKFINSLKLLFVKPGQLARNMTDGIRVPYMKLISLFFFASFLYYLFPVFDSYNSTLYTQMNSLGEHSVKASEIVKKTIEKESISFEDFQTSYNNTSTNLSKILIILLVVAFTFFLAIINYSKRVYFFDHLLFSLEFYTYQLILNSVILANLLKGLVKLMFFWNLDWNYLMSDSFFSLIATLTILYFLIQGQRVFYGQKWYWYIPKSILLIVLMLPLLLAYRQMLFYITLWVM